MDLGVCEACAGRVLEVKIVNMEAVVVIKVILLLIF